jgi:AraC-like DNA-binding protein
MIGRTGPVAVPELAPVDEGRPQRIRVDERGTDLEAARAVLAAAYGGVEWQADLGENDFSFHYAAAGDDAMTLRHVQFEGSLSGEMVAGDDIVVQWLTRGTGTLDVGDAEIELKTGHARMWPQGSFRFAFRDWDQRLVQMNRRFVEKLAEERGVAPHSLTLDHRVDPDPKAMQVWRNSISLISRSVLDQNASPLLQAEMGRLAGLSLLELYPQDETPLPPELLLPKNARLRAAVEHIHENAHLPLTPVDVAEAAGLSARGLQQAFQRLFDVTPHGYIRQVRLARIRDELLNSEPSSTSVADVALTWGFGHAGRFSASYAAEFGEYPRDTLRRDTHRGR